MYFSVFKNHYSLFFRKFVVLAFAKELKPYRRSVATISFPLDKPAQVKLITKLVKFAAKVNLEKTMLKGVY